MSQWKRHVAVGVTSSLVLLGAGCGSSQPDAVPPEQPPAQEQGQEQPQAMQRMPMQPTTPPELTDEQKAQLAAGEQAHEPKELTFNVKGGMFFYVPDAMKVKKGDKVKIIFENVGGTHNFELDEFNIKTANLKTGESETVEFVADKVGTFEYYCGVGQHRQMGQKGTLTVVE